MRFPDFNDDWTQCYYKDIFDIIVEKNNNLELENVVSASLIYGVISRNELGVDIKYSSESIRGYKIVRDGDYIIHLRSFQGGFAFSRLNGICSPAYTILRPKPLYISYGFFEKYFTSSRFINSLKLVTYGIRDGRSIAVDEWMQEVGSLPSLAEQKKIADFLSLIDERIQSCSEAIKELKTQKAGLLNQLFSQKLRFPDFNDDWKETTLGEVLIKPQQKAVEDPTNTELITVKLHCKGIVNTGKYPNKTEKGRAYYIRYTGELLIGKQNFHNGGIGIVPHVCSGKICSNAIASYISKDQYIEYIYYYISRETYYSLFEKYLGGTGQKEISASEFNNLPISLPSLEEQRKIADFLSLIDERIEVEEQLLKKYEEQKKYLLRKMFV